VGFIESTVLAMAVICVIAFLCQAWSTNMATLVPDLTSRSETASVMGMLGTSGSLGGIAFAQVLGVSIGLFGYSSAFVMAAVLHPLSLLMLFVLLRPNLRK
jgi:ACS family hexuronate transporter-like MFS transporter